MGAFSFSLPAILLSILSILGATMALNYSFPYGSEKIRGVGLGGWLVMSPWMTPSLFDNTGNSSIIDEWTFCQYQDRATAHKALEHHWKTWITESDFATIAAAGLNHVEIPIGYWAFDVSDAEPYIQGQLPYLMKAVSWAEKYGLKVIVYLFGLPGSQNGFASSGQVLPAPTWQDSQTNIDRSNAIVRELVMIFAGRANTVSVIAPVDEPHADTNEAQSKLLDVTKQYYYDSYGTIRHSYGTYQEHESSLIVMISSAFEPLTYWDNFMPPPKWEGVLLETRYYDVWTYLHDALNISARTSRVCSFKTNLTSSPLWTVVDQWTPASTDCAKNINGRGAGAYYDGSYPGSTRVGSCTGLTGNGASFDATYKAFLRQNWEAQVQAFEAGSQGWMQWTWKTENADEWSYEAGLINGWIPWDPTDYMYPDICSSG